MVVLEALQWYRRAADQGDPDAINSIGFYYQHGLGGLPQDYAKARALFEQAAAKDWPPAINNLGLLYEKGRASIAIMRKPENCMNGRRRMIMRNR